jgi:hypothetical protein
MQHNNSFRRILFVLVFLLYPFFAWAQVHIKERIEIRPKPPAIRTAPASASEMPLFTEGQRNLNRSQGLAVVVTRPATIIATGTIQVSPGPGGEYPNTDLTIYYGGSVCANYRKYPGSDPNTYSAPVTRTIRCGYTGPDLWSALSALGLEDVNWNIGSSTATITFTGELGGLYPYTATANLSASADNSYDLSTIAVSSNRTSVTRCDNTASVTIQLQDAAGRAFPSGNCGSQPDLMTISFSSTTATLPSLTIDWSEITSSGSTLEAADRSGQLTWDPVSPDEEGQVTLLVEASGKSGSTTITLSKEAPPPVLSLNYYENIIFGMKSPINVAAQDCKRVGVSLSPGVTYQFSMINGPGLLREPSTGAQGKSLGSIAHVQGKASVTYSSRDTLFASSTRIEVKASDHSIVPVYADIQITPTDLVVTLDKNPVYFGDSTTLTVKLKNPDGTLSSIPSEWVTTYNFIDDDTLAFFSTPDEADGGTFVWGNYPWVRVNTRPQVAPPDSVELIIGVWSYNSGGGGIPTSARPSELITLKKGQKAPGMLFPRNDGERKKTIVNAHSDANSQVRPTLQEEGGGSLDHFGIATLVVKSEKPKLDHFLVLATRDTIAHDDACVLIVVAQDAHNNEVKLDSNKVIGFSVDSSQYGSYLVSSSERLSSKEIELPYGLARDAEVQYVSDGINPILQGPKTLSFRVFLKEDPTKNGTLRLTIKDKAFITIRLTKSELKPLGDSHNTKADPACVSKAKNDTCLRIVDFSKVDTCTLTLAVKDRLGIGIGDYPFWIQTGVRDSSGGHDHRLNRPTGRLIIGDKDTVRIFHGKTDSTGKMIFKYLCSGFGGFDSIYAEGLTSKDTATCKTPVWVKNMDSLSTGTRYRLIGQYGTSGVTSKHRRNHYGTSNAIEKLKALADSLFQDDEYVLRINDMSIEFGGPFDISNNWNTPHQSHREGVSIDIDEVDANDYEIDSEYLERIVTCRSFRGTFFDEGNHFHVTFR